MCPQPALLQKHGELTQIIFVSEVGLFFVWDYTSRDLSGKQEKATKM